MIMSLDRLRYVKLLRELDVLLEYFHGSELNGLLYGVGNIEWWLQDTERLSNLVEIAQRYQENDLGILSVTLRVIANH